MTVIYIILISIIVASFNLYLWSEKWRERYYVKKVFLSFLNDNGYELHENAIFREEENIKIKIMVICVGKIVNPNTLRIFIEKGEDYIFRDINFY